MNLIQFKDFIRLQRGHDLPKKFMIHGEYPVIGSTSIIGRHNEYKYDAPGVITGRSGSLGVVQYTDEKYWPHNTALWVKDFKGNFLVYSKSENFELYLLRVIAAYRIEYKNNYISLTFSIDPGKKIGLMIFLDDYYLDSFCCYEKDELLVAIKNNIHTFQDNNPNLMVLTFKLGMGVPSITYELIENIFKFLHGRKNVNIFLINEYKSSKMRIIKKQKERNFSKDEISALILAFRKGIEVNEKNYDSIYKQKRLNKLQNEGVFKRNFEKIDENINTLGEIAENVLHGEISLKESTRLINEIRYY